MVGKGRGGLWLRLYGRDGEFLLHPLRFGCGSFLSCAIVSLLCRPFTLLCCLYQYCLYFSCFGRLVSLRAVVCAVCMP